MVLCYGAVFFLVVPFVAFIVLPKTGYFRSFWAALGVILAPFAPFWWPWAPQGTSGGPPAVKSGLPIDLGRFCPPLWGTNFGTFSIKSSKSRVLEVYFVRLAVNTRFFYKIVEK